MSDGRAGYALLYRIGLRPWEFDDTPPELATLGEASGDPEPGRALDLGCGAGKHALRVAGRGWEVVGVDFVARAVERARARAAAAGVNARFVVGDVTRLRDLDLGGTFDVVYDVKCFHGLPESSRPSYLEAVSQSCRPGGLYLLYALEPGRFRRLSGEPRGVARADVERLFGGGFDLLGVRPAARGPFEPVTYRMRRR